MDKQLLLLISRAHDALSNLWLELRDDEQRVADKAKVQEMMNQLKEMIGGDPDQD